MPVIYLKHPVHGRKIAIAEEEAKNDEKNGWKRFSIETPEAIVEPVVENSLVQRRKPGRPPRLEKVE